MTREHFDAQLRELDQSVIALGRRVSDAIEQGIASLEYLDAARAHALIEADKEIDQQRYDIESQALHLIATQQPLAIDLRTIASILTIVTELERIGDYCEGIARLTLRMAADPVNAPIQDIRSMANKTRALLEQALSAFALREIDLAGKVWMGDDEVDALYEQVFRKVLMDMVSDKTHIRQGTYVIWIAHNVERMADRVTNIAERVAFIVTGEVGIFRDRLRAQSVPD